MLKRVLTSVVVFLVLLGLGALAVLARPGGFAASPMVLMSASPLDDDSVPAGQPAAAPAATQNYNMIALPLDAADFFATQGYSFTAKGLANYIGSSVVSVRRWITSTQSYQTSNKPFSFNNFQLQTGGVYVVLLDATNPITIFTILGNVPPPSQTTPQGTPGRVEYVLAGASPNCQYNMITVPLDRSDLNTAKLLAQAIGNVSTIRQWKANTQSYQTSSSPFTFNNFSTTIGYPYVVCLTAGANGQIWP
jgi:hypothetical protein